MPSTAKQLAKQLARKERLMPDGIPRWIRCYDNGGVDAENGSVDRYTVVFTGKAAPIKVTPSGGLRSFPYLGMSGEPFHPQGFCQHGEHNNQPLDTIKPNSKGFTWAWPPAIGRRNHLGKRIHFKDLPADCQKVVLDDYKNIWGLDL